MVPTLPEHLDLLNQFQILLKQVHPIGGFLSLVGLNNSETTRDHQKTIPQTEFPYIKNSFAMKTFYNLSFFWSFFNGAIICQG